MQKSKLRVVSVGTDWFVPFMEEQGIEVFRIDWSPPVERPKDISAILSKISKR
ncbi:MAG: hypothetical protein QXP70_01045 [Methanomassiliicoccales archaeon]